MKRLTFLIASFAFIIAGTMISFANTSDTDGHALLSLWKEYDQAMKADKPKTQLEVLGKIKAEAVKQKQPWDFFDAARKTVDVRQRINWKDVQPAREDYRKEIFDYGEPIVVVSYYLSTYSNTEAHGYIKENRQKLEAGRHTAFYEQLGLFSNLPYREVLANQLKNDYEFALWALFSCAYQPANEDMDAIVAGRYPAEPFVLYTRACRLPMAGRKDALKAIIKDYPGKAVTMLPRDLLLSMKFNELTSNGKTTSKEYSDFRAECQSFVDEREKFKGLEASIAACCHNADNLIENLDSKEILTDIDNGELTVSLRNLGKVQVQVLKDKKSVWSIMLFNKENSYYVYDRVKTQIPATLEDGDYEIKCTSGKVVEIVPYEKFTLSIASRYDTKGFAVYVADYMTGEPVKSCTLELVDVSDKTVATANATLDGYTYLPDDFKSLVSNKKANFRVRAVYNDGQCIRRSRCISLYRWNGVQVAEEKVTAAEQRALVITDRAAFKPGETVKFKVILYEGRYEYKVSGAGKTVTVVLRDQEDKEVAKKFLSVNEFGAAAGEFDLSDIEKGGIYSIAAIGGDQNILGNKDIRVDEFVLPTYELVWDKTDRFYLPGETIKVSGTVKAYSGHSLSGAKIEYKVNSFWKGLTSGTLTVGENGHFEIEFDGTDQPWGIYKVDAKVIDATGETLEFSTEAYSGDDIPLSVSLENQSKGSCDLGIIDRSETAMLGADLAAVRFDVSKGDARQLTHPNLKIEYKLRHGTKVVASGKAVPGEVVKIDMSGLPSGNYELCAEASAKAKGKDYSTARYLNIIKLSDSDTALPFEAESFFKEVSGDDDIALQFGSTDGPTWAVVELYGSGVGLLEHKIVKLSGGKDSEGSLVTVRYPFKDSYPSTVTLRVFWFKNASCCTYTMTVNNQEKRSVLPLSFTRFLDTTAPGLEYTFSVKTDAGVECAATIYDISTETMMPNGWHRVVAPGRPAPQVSYDHVFGNNGTSYRPLMTKGRAMMSRSVTANTALAVNEEAVSLEDMAVEVLDYVQEVPSVQRAEYGNGSGDPIAVRQDFASTVAFEPFLRSDKNGVVNFTFRTTDKLSRYYVQLFAHDKDMRTNVLREEMTITIPVKVAVVEPQVLYNGDRYVVRVNVANTLDRKVPGKLSVKFIDGDDYKKGKAISSRSVRLNVVERGNASSSLELKSVGDISKLGILVSFEADDKQLGSDAVFVAVPVSKPVQTITESHSAIMHPEDDREELESMLRAEFVNSDGMNAKVREISIRQMLGEALPESIDPESDNVLALTDALYARYLLSKLTGRKFDSNEIEAKIKFCRNSDGGFGWFEGMASSAVVTAVVLERFASMGRTVDGIDGVVRYLDLAQLGGSKVPYWCGGIGYDKYMYVRAMYSGVKFDTKGMDSDRLKEFRQYAKEYLVPAQDRGLQGRILEKARRLLTLRSLISSPAGESLAKSWGVASVSKLAASVKADTESLYEYAVEHKCGGCYFPNAVMPFRGLLESELYAHALLCDLFATTERSDISDGIRMWMMIQKETQQWQPDPAYIQALNSVFRGGEEILGTRVLALSTTTEIPFSEIKASGNGFTIERKYFVSHENGDWKELAEGETLKVGDRVRGDYRIWNEENRSFVHLDVPRPACLRPENQLSGYYGWWANPLRAEGWYTFSPQGYRCVRADKTEYWFDTYPEENTVVSETFFVTQEGTFQTGVPVIESLYAPHYRANSAGTSPVTAE